MTRLPNTPGGQLLRAIRLRSGESQLRIETEADLGTGYLQRLELGKVQRPTRATLERLLNALGATHYERQVLLASYGYMLTLPLPTTAELAWATKVAQSTLHDSDYPAYVLDCAYRLVAWNNYMPLLLGVESIRSRSQRLAGHCLIDIFFEPAYAVYQRIENADHFLPYLACSFHRESLPYRSERWWQDLIARLTRDLPLFQRFWASIEHGQHQASAAQVPPLLINTREQGVLQFRIAIEPYHDDPRFRLVSAIPLGVETITHCTAWGQMVAT